MESGDILDEQITASSSFDEDSVGPQNSRIKTERGSGAWCPKAQIRNGSYEFLQISLNSTHVIRRIETQGRYGNGTGVEYTNNYFVDYFRSGGSWVRYRNRTGQQLMTGNGDTVSSVFVYLDPPIQASRVRIVLHSEQTRTMCLRVELHGCEDVDHLEGYSMSRDGTGGFQDRIFEETKEVDTILGSSKGLGLLFDGFAAWMDPHLTKNSSYIGWNRNTTHGSVILIFEFARVRNFTDVELYGWGQSPDQVHVEFSSDGTVFDPDESILSTYPRQMSEELQKAYSVRIPLPERSGKFVRFRLTFQGQWIYLTEIDFNTGKTPESGQSMLVKLKNKAAKALKNALFEGGPLDEAGNHGSYNIWSYVIVSVLVLLIILFFVILFLIHVMKRRYHRGKKISTDTNGVYKSGLLVTTLGGNGAPRNILQPPMQAPKLLAQFNGSFFPASGDSNSMRKMLSNSSRSCSSGTMSKDTPPSLLDINFPPPPPSTGSSELEPTYAEHTATSVPLLPDQPSTSSSSANNTPQRRRKAVSAPSRRHKTLPNRPSVVDEEGLLDQVQLQLSPQRVMSAVVRIPVKSITLMDHIGEGKFTAIYVCQIDGIGQPAVIKMVKPDAEDVQAAEKALFCETQMLAALDHPNLIKLYGACDEAAVVMEYLPVGSIRGFIQLEREKLSLGSLLHFCTNIAAGMKYLEKLGIVHGHLSPRNCLLDNKLNVKISGPRGPLHHAQLRYSAPESIILNQWTHKSDSFSFGVTAWEILHYCDQIPFEHMTNQDIVTASKNIVNGENQNMRLAFRDECCPPEIRDLLTECFDAHPETRPAFLELQLFLSRKAMSFTLQHKRQRPSGLALPQSASMYK